MSLLASADNRSAIRRGEPGAKDRLLQALRSALGETPSTSITHEELWSRLAAYGRYDLVFARLLEGHIDATRILAQANKVPAQNTMYGVWASASGGTGAQAAQSADGSWMLSGSLRYCSGFDVIDRALITARTDDGQLLLFDVEVHEGCIADRNSWAAVGMDLSNSYDVEIKLEVAADSQVGPPGFYLERPGFSLGGIGVAAVWLGGAAGVLDAVRKHLHSGSAGEHQLAHFGVMATAIAQADALMAETARSVDKLTDAKSAALLCRSAVDSAVEVVLQHAPRLTGPTPLCRDGDFAHRLADLSVYVRQHHAERDLAALGSHFLESK